MSWFWYVLVPTDHYQSKCNFKQWTKYRMGAWEGTWRDLEVRDFQHNMQWTGSTDLGLSKTASLTTLSPADYVLFNTRDNTWDRKLNSVSIICFCVDFSLLSIFVMAELVQRNNDLFLSAKFCPNACHNHLNSCLLDMLYKSHLVVSFTATVLSSNSLPKFTVKAPVPPYTAKSYHYQCNDDKTWRSSP